MNKEKKDKPDIQKNKAPEVQSPAGAEGQQSAEAAATAGGAQTPSEAGPQKGGKGGRKPFTKRKEAVPSEFVEQVVAINRITKVTKGGKKLSFSALVVVGDTKGRVGYSLAKAGEVAIAIKKALTSAKRGMIVVPLHQSTITHQVIGCCGAARVLLKPAAEGTGVIAAGPVRAICDSAGIRNILTKCHRSNNPINVVKATIDGLSRLKARSFDERMIQTAAQPAPQPTGVAS